MLTDRSNAMIAVNSILPSLAVFATVLRLYAKKLKNLPLQAHDYIFMVALVMTIATSLTFIYGAARGGIGQHYKTLHVDELIIFGKVAFWTQFTYLFAVSLIKLSILLFYKSLFPTRRFLLTVNILCAVLLLWAIAFFFATLFQTSPISLNYKFAMYLGLAWTELILDVITLTLPWTVIWRLQMKTSQKLSVLAIFMLGGLVCISSAFRIYYFDTTHTSAHQDFTYEVYNTLMWTAIEPSLGIVCACLPTLAPIFQGGHSPANLLRSIRSYIHLRSESNHTNNSSNLNICLPETSKAPNDSLNPPNTSTIMTSIQGRKTNDLENQSITGGGIYVHQVLAMESEYPQNTLHQV